MNRISLVLKRPFIWLYRFRHRCGYEVYSPFAPSLIIRVIYETILYYKYRELTAEQGKLAPQKDRTWSCESVKVRRLLFRLASHAQPATIVDTSIPAASPLYLKAVKREADYIVTADLFEPFLEGDTSVDFLYLYDYRRPGLVGGALHICITRTAKKSVFVVESVRYTSQMYAV